MPIDSKEIHSASLLNKFFPSHRKKIFDEFLKFKSNDTNVTTLNISAKEMGEMNGSYNMTWNRPNDFTQTMHGRSDLANNAALFEWQPDSGSNTSPPSCKNLPFDDEAFDWVFCEAVIERIGSAERQYLLLQELMRVAKKGVFITTFNRWHPIEFYTTLPLLHWLPTVWWKRILKLLGKGSWASESMLNLLDSTALKKFVGRLPDQPSCSIGHLRFMGLKAYFFLQIKKSTSAEMS